MISCGVGFGFSVLSFEFWVLGFGFWILGFSAPDVVHFLGAHHDGLDRSLHFQDDLAECRSCRGGENPGRYHPALQSDDYLVYHEAIPMRGQGPRQPGEPSHLTRT